MLINAKCPSTSAKFTISLYNLTLRAKCSLQSTDDERRAPVLEFWPKNNIFTYLMSTFVNGGRQFVMNCDAINTDNERTVNTTHKQTHKHDIQTSKLII
jgi:hypothetical protein